jgi:hypothetical protein
VVSDASAHGAAPRGDLTAALEQAQQAKLVQVIDFAPVLARILAKQFSGDGATTEQQVLSQSVHDEIPPMFMVVQR